MRLTVFVITFWSAEKFIKVLDLFIAIPIIITSESYA